MNVSECFWFSVKCIFRHVQLENDDTALYEERIILVNSQTDQLALQIAEQEAKHYANDAGCEYLDFAFCFQLYDEKVIHLSEVSSVMRESLLPPDDYLKTFYSVEQRML